MVTGPTVITPLLRRIKVKPRVATALEAEGVLVDAIGAIVAVVALEVAIGPPGRAVAFGAWHVASRLFFGVLLGAAGGRAIAALLRFEKTLTEGLESVFTLAIVLLLYQGSNAIVPETGIVTAVVAGFVVGNARAHVVAELREFKEQLSVMLIGLLFVLPAADVRMIEVAVLGWAGIGLVAALMFVARPLSVLVGTWGTDLTWRERAFLGWLAPRGIVAAAISSLFVETLQEEGIAGGSELRAMVFLVIAEVRLVAAHLAAVCPTGGWQSARWSDALAWAHAPPSPSSSRPIKKSFVPNRDEARQLLGFERSRRLTSPQLPPLA